MRPVPRDGDRTRNHAIEWKREAIDADQSVSGADPLDREVGKGRDDAAIHPVSDMAISVPGR